MKFKQYAISKLTVEALETFILQIRPKTDREIFRFKPGQYCYIKNPIYKNSDEAHIFSIASSPNTKTYLEFCIKVYGNWTKNLSEMKKGKLLYINGPFGRFTWDSTEDHNAVFLVGGIGISPIMSVLRYINNKRRKGNFLLIYGNRTQETIAYKQELEMLAQQIEKLRIVHIFSHLLPNDPWQGYRGFVTSDVLQKEVNFHIKPTFFVIGPQIFITKMDAILKQYDVQDDKTKHEIIT